MTTLRQLYARDLHNLVHTDLVMNEIQLISEGSGVSVQELRYGAFDEEKKALWGEYRKQSSDCGLVEPIKDGWVIQLKHTITVDGEEKDKLNVMLPNLDSKMGETTHYKQARKTVAYCCNLTPQDVDNMAIGDYMNILTTVMRQFIY